VAFVILAASIQEPRRKIERAISDARAIHVLASSSPFFKAMNDGLEQSADNFVKYSGSGKWQKGRNVRIAVTWPDGKSEKFVLSGPLDVVYASDIPYEGEDDIANPAYSYVPFRVRSLKEFIHFWDYNQKDHVFVVPQIEKSNIVTVAWFRSLTVEVDAKSFQVADIEPGSDEDEHARYSQLHAGIEDKKLKFVTYPDRTEPLIEIDVPLIPLPDFNAQAFLRSYTKKDADWLPGQFASSFPELNERTRNISTIDLRELTTELNDQANREQEKIELLGAKLDPVILTRWGLLIVAVCQFYLWLHLNALLESVGHFDDGSLSGWIGLYPGIWARSFTVASLMLPSAIAIYWLSRQWTGLSSRWQIVESLNALICLLLGFATVRTLVLVRSQTTAQPQDAPKKDMLEMS
jgi:hypothetical protein